jgi:hypothetical protein
MNANDKLVFLCLYIHKIETGNCQSTFLRKEYVIFIRDQMNSCQTYNFRIKVGNLQLVYLLIIQGLFYNEIFVYHR